MQQLFTQESLPMLVAAARRRIKQLAWEHMRPCGVTPQQGGVILALLHQDGVSLSDLARALHLDNPTACRIINTLSKRKLVGTSPDVEDRRRFRLHLTASGKRLGRELTARANAVSDVLDSKLSASDTAALRALLKRFVHNLESDDQPVETTPRKRSKRRA